LKFTRRQLGYLFFGLIFWLPIGVLVLVGDYIFGNLEKVGKDFLHLFVPERFVYTGLGVVLWLLIFYFTGLLFRRTNIGTYFSNIPILGGLFRTGGETMTIDRLTNLAPCLFLLSPTCLSYGWILSQEKIKLNGEGANFQLIDVYYPNVPTIVTGQVFSVRKETVMKLGNPSRDMIDILLYALRKPEHLTYLPWEDETAEQFQERAARFGLLITILSPMEEKLPSPTRANPEKS
jgi:hypothetical protein